MRLLDTRVSLCAVDLPVAFRADLVAEATSQLLAASILCSPGDAFLASLGPSLIFRFFSFESGLAKLAGLFLAAAEEEVAEELVAVGAPGNFNSRCTCSW